MREKVLDDDLICRSMCKHSVRESSSSQDQEGHKWHGPPNRDFGKLRILRYGGGPTDNFTAEGR